MNDTKHMLVELKKLKSTRQQTSATHGKMDELQTGARPYLHHLPVEIRLPIYGYMTPPLDSHLADWRGLFISCKLFHYEMKDEFRRSMKRYLNQVEEQWAVTHDVPLKFITPAKDFAIGTLTIAIPNSYFRILDSQFPATRIVSTADSLSTPTGNHATHFEEI